MPRRVAEVGEGHEDGNGVYGIIRDLIVEGKDARFVNKKGRYVVNWSRALDCFTDYKAKKNPPFKSKAVSRRKISNGLRSALLNYYKKEGAKEYKDAKKVNENDEVVERQFQMPPRLFKSMFREVGPTITEDSEEDDQEDTSSLLSNEGDDKPEVSLSTSTSDTGFDEFMDMSSNEIVEPLESSLSVAGNFLTDLGLDVIKTEGEETSVDLSDVQLPPASQMFDPSMLDSAIEEICSDGISDDISDEGIDLLGVVQDICPTSGSIKGGFQFYISLTEELPDEVKTGVAQFERVANVMVYKLNPFTLTGTVPSSQVPGEVAVTVVTDAGKKLGMTCFRYIDEMREMVRQIVKDPTLQSLWFAMWSQEHGFFGNDSNIAQVLGPIDLQGQDSSVQTKQQQSVKVLQLLVYTAAQTDAREFIEMVFSTSAGQIVFNSYKDRTPLPEDVALANGHEELAQYLTDINTRLSKETFEDVQSCTIDWLELVKAVQKQSSQDESTKGLQQPSDTDDTSDYFADVETSSCGSSDHDIVWTNMSDNKAAWKCPRGSPILQEPCTDEDIFNDVHPVGTSMSENGPSNKCPLKATNSNVTLKKAEESTQRPTTRPVVDKKGTPRKHEAHLDNENDKEGVSCGSFAHTFDCISRWWKKKDSGPIARAQDNCLDEKEEELPSKSRSLFQGLFWRGSDTSEANVHGASGPHMTKPKECHKRPGRATGRSTRKKEAGLNYKGVVLTFALLTVLAGFKLKEGQILHWAVGNGYTQFSKMLLQCGVYVDVPGLLKETPLHLAAKNGFRDLVDVLVRSGGNVNARNFPMQETPLHLATRNGHRHIAQFLVQQGSQVNARNFPMQETPLHLAARNGHQLIAQFLIQQGSQVNARNVPSRETPLHLASRNGHQQIAEVLIQHGGQVNAKNRAWQETPLHLASRNGHQEVVELLIQQGGDVNSRNIPSQESPLHLVAKNGHQSIAEFLVKQGSQGDVRNLSVQGTPLHLAVQNGHQHSLDARNDLKQGPLHLAAMNSHLNIAEFLLQRGRPVNARNCTEPPLPFTVMNRHRVADVTGVRHKAKSDKKLVQSHLAARNGQQHVRELSVNEGRDVQKHVADADNRSDASVSKRHQEPTLWLNAEKVIGGLNFHCYTRVWEQTILPLSSQTGLLKIAQFPISGQLIVQSKETPFNFTAEEEKHATELLTQYVINGTAQIEENVPGYLSRIRCHGHVRLLNDHKRVCNLISRLQSLHLATKGDQKQAAILIQQGRNVTAQNSFTYTSLLLLASKNCWPRYLCHQNCAPCQNFPTKISLCTVAHSSLSDAVRKIDKGLSQYSHKFGQTERVDNDSIYGAIKNGFAVHATFLWFSALYTVSAMTLVALLWWKCHRREHCLRRFHILPLPDNTLQPKPKILLHPGSHDNYVEEFAVIGARCEGCAHYKSTMKALSRRSTPTFCNDVGVLFHQKHTEVARAERMERVRTWLEYNQHGQEEMASLDSEVLSGPSTVVKECDELSNNKALDTAGIILIRGPSKRSLTVMKLSLHFQSRGRPVHYLTLKGLTCKTDLKQKLARKPDEAVLIIEEIDELLASGLPEVTEVIQLLEELLSQNKSFTLDLCPQADSEGCLNGDRSVLSDKQSTLSMKTICLKAWKVGQLIQALSTTEDFSDENVLLNSAETVQGRGGEQRISEKSDNRFKLCTLDDTIVNAPLIQRRHYRKITDFALPRESGDVLVDKFTGTGEVDETYLDTGAVDEKELSTITRVLRHGRFKLLKSEQKEKASVRKGQFSRTRRLDEMLSALRTIHRCYVLKATALSTRTSDCWDIVLTNESWRSLYDTEASLSIVGDVRTNLDENSSVRDFIGLFSCLPRRAPGEKTESEKIFREKVPYLVAEGSAKLKQIFDEIIPDEGSDEQCSEMVSYMAVLRRSSQVQGNYQATKNMDKEFHKFMSTVNCD